MRIITLGKDTSMICVNGRRRGENFPIWSERFDDVDDGKLKSNEKDKLAAAAVDALSNDGNLVVDDAAFLRKF